MTLSVRQFPCRTDNYGFLVRDEATGMVAAVDTPDAEAILKDLEASGWGRLDFILNTHWHPDHTEGNARLKAEMGCVIYGPEEVKRTAPLDHIVHDGDEVRLGETVFRVAETPGHTLGHVIFHAVEEKLAFVGDVIFALGCGRLFEGTPDQMWESLQHIASWDEATLLYCAHEYTASNARFALSLSREPQLVAHCQAIFAKRENGEATVPTTVGIEKRYNPFLTADVDTFAERRAAKDGFSG